jgi:hypothetical protein
MEADMNIEFGKIFSRAWNITWKHKILWFFGFLSILAGGENLRVSSNSGYRFSSGDMPRYTGQLPPEIQSIIDWFTNLDWGAIVAYASIAITLLCLLWLVFIVLSIIGRGGLIGGIAKADADGAVSLREAWGYGRRYFWQILAIGILEFLTMFALVLFIGVPIAILAVIPVLCCVGIPLAVVAIAGLLFLSLYFYYVRIGVVVEDLGLAAGFGRAFNILRDNITPSFLIGLVTFVVNLGVGLVTLVIFVPSGGLFFAAFWPMIAEMGTINMGILYAAIIVGLVTLPVAWLMESVLVTWRTSVWTLAYKQFLKKAPPLPPAVVS